MNDNLISSPPSRVSSDDAPLSLEPIRDPISVQPYGSERLLKIFLALLFLPEGLSLFVGDFRLPVYRVLILAFLPVAIRAARRKANLSASVRIPSDFFALATGAWIVVAGVINDGVAIGLKGSGATALEFTGTYILFRHLLGPIDSSVRVIKFGCLVMIFVIGLALLDPLTGHLFTYDLVRNLTGYGIPIDYTSESYFRDGMARAMGPMEHSLLFATACIWFGTLALFTFRFNLFGISIAILSLVGIWFSQSRGPLAAYAISMCLMLYNAAAKNLRARWKIVELLVVVWISFVFVYSSSPVSTLLSFGGIDPAAGWYREAIWSTAGQFVLSSPIVGVGTLIADWWQSNPTLTYGTMDSLWLVNAFCYGIPCSLLIFLTVVSAFWLGPIENSTNLSDSEQRLSVGLGIALALGTFMGFIVHFWGICWVLLAVLPGIRANLAECAIARDRVLHL